MAEMIFTFTRRSFDAPSATATFEYALDREEGTQLHFKETLQFKFGEDIAAIPQPLLEHLLDNLHLVLGLSYWKMYAPRNVKIPQIRLSKQQAKFWTTLYTYGMGEFFYKNQLDFQNYLEFPSTAGYEHDYFSLPLQSRSLVGIGGGKDSVVAVELLKKAEKSIIGFVVENNGQQHTSDQLVKDLGIDVLKVNRTIDGQVQSLPDTYKGHIPISAMYAFLGITAACLYNFKHVVVANEHSSNYGNVEYLGETVNHQWSKSQYFEKLMQDYIADSISPDLHYFSLLRPFSELKIAQLFVNYPQYFSTFTSCNRNYRINPSKPLQSKWCGECPKCAFAFVLLSAFLPAEEVIKIFNKNLFEDEKLVPLYRELLGLKDIKPFDCVGTPDEVSLAFFLTKEKGSFANTPVLAMFEKEYLPSMSATSVLQHRLLEQKEDHLIPTDMLPVIAEL